MERKSDLQLLFSQRIVLNQSLRFYLKILEMNRQELQEFINSALVENPFFEVRDGIYGENLDDLGDSQFYINSDSSYISNFHSNSNSRYTEINEEGYYSADNSSVNYNGGLFSQRKFLLNEDSWGAIEDYALSNAAAPQNSKEEFFKHLAFFKFNPKEKAIGEMLFDYLLEHQYLSGEFLKSISKNNGISYTKLLILIKKLQGIPPYGMFSFNLQDRLKSIWEISGKYDLQHQIFLQNISFLLEKHKDVEHFRRQTKLSDKDFSAIMRDVKDILRYSHSMNDFSEDFVCEKCSVDLHIKRCKESCEVESCNTFLPIVRNDLFKKFWRRTRSEIDKKYMQEKIRDAELLVKALNHRNSTLLKICREITCRQIDFFMGDSSFLVPINTRSIATAIMCHPSTVHRAISNKFVDTPCGIFSLKDLMPREISTSKSDQIATSKSVQDYIRKMIKEEPSNSPYSDEELSYFLGLRGIRISRRTIAKYRKNLAIANSNERMREKQILEATGKYQ